MQESFAPSSHRHELEACIKLPLVTPNTELHSQSGLQTWCGHRSVRAANRPLCLASSIIFTDKKIQKKYTQTLSHYQCEILVLVSINLRVDMTCHLKWILRGNYDAVIGGNWEIRRLDWGCECDVENRMSTEDFGICLMGLITILN